MFMISSVRDRRLFFGINTDLRINHNKVTHKSSQTYSGGSRISRRGDVDLTRGADSPGGYVSKILYVETKESGPLGGRAPGTPPRSASVNITSTSSSYSYSLQMFAKIQI